LFAKYLELISHDPELYKLWESCYDCIFLQVLQKRCLKANAKSKGSAIVSFVLYVNIRDIPDPTGDLRFLSDEFDQTKTAHKITYNLVKKFFGSCSAFHSCRSSGRSIYLKKENGVINHLAILPQINEEASVHTREPHPDPVEFFRTMEHDSCPQYHCRCWLHTNPNRIACLSPEDIFQMYKNRNMFALVISPVKSGLKALCVELTQAGRELIQDFYESDMLADLDAQDDKNIVQKIRDSSSKFYVQVPFELCLSVCHVVDLRSKEEISSQIAERVSGKEKIKVWNFKKK